MDHHEPRSTPRRSRASGHRFKQASRATPITGLGHKRIDQWNQQMNTVRNWPGAGAGGSQGPPGRIASPGREQEGKPHCGASPDHRTGGALR